MSALRCSDSAHAGAIENVLCLEVSTITLFIVNGTATSESAVAFASKPC